jgi:hypothetical protein
LMSNLHPGLAVLVKVGEVSVSILLALTQYDISTTIEKFMEIQSVVAIDSLKSWRGIYWSVNDLINVT